MDEKQINEMLNYTKNEIQIAIWNAAIEAAANSIHGKFDAHGWNYHLPSVGREMEYEIRKLKK